MMRKLQRANSNTKSNTAPEMRKSFKSMNFLLLYQNSGYNGLGFTRFCGVRRLIINKVWRHVQTIIRTASTSMLTNVGVGEKDKIGTGTGIK